jgi:8-oxo-dGTP diphosphatase
MRPRVCAAIIQDDKILMVRHKHKGREYWTLPGGGIEEGESHEQALVREVFEETQLKAKVIKFLFDEAYSKGITYCYLAAIDGNGEARLGSDPEDFNKPPQDRILQEVKWLLMENMRNDRQVSKVMKYLSQ